MGWLLILRKAALQGSHSPTSVALFYFIWLHMQLPEYTKYLGFIYRLTTWKNSAIFCLLQALFYNSGLPFDREIIAADFSDLKICRSFSSAKPTLLDFFIEEHAGRKIHRVTKPTTFHNILNLVFTQHYKC